MADDTPNLVAHVLTSAEVLAGVDQHSPIGDAMFEARLWCAIGYTLYARDRDNYRQQRAFGLAYALLLDEAGWQTLLRAVVPSTTDAVSPSPATPNLVAHALATKALDGAEASVPIGDEDSEARLWQAIGDTLYSRDRGIYELTRALALKLALRLPPAPPEN